MTSRTRQRGFVGAANAMDLIVNGSFETGSFSGWTASTTGTPFLPWLISPSGAGAGFSLVPTAPQDGLLDAWNGFDGAGPMEFDLYQDVTIPVSASSATFTSMHRVQWNFALTGTATQPRLFDVSIRDTGNAILLPLFSFSTGTALTIGDTGWMTTAVDLSAYAGSTVRVFFRETIPETFTGPGQVEIDRVSLTAEAASPVPEPATLLLLSSGLIGLARYGRKKFFRK